MMPIPRPDPEIHRFLPGSSYVPANIPQELARRQEQI
jgi:hypothetical protein